jgi:membrane protease YdiL (CAAX protease family)
MVFIKRHALLTYFALTFAISWGGFVLVLGRAGLASTNWQAEARFAYAVAAMLAGPTVAGILLTGILDGRPGLGELLSRLLMWRANAGWYAFAILPAPLIAVAVLRALSIPAPIFTAANKSAVIIPGMVAGLTAVFEEVGWTGFVVPRLRRRHGVFATGLVLGVVWGAWHLLQQIFISGTYTGGLPVALYLALAIANTIAGLTAYRVLMVWLYERTGSLLIVTLMHASLIASTIFILRPEATGVAFLTYEWTFTAATWLVVAAVTAISGTDLSGRRGSAMSVPE